MFKLDALPIHTACVYKDKSKYATAAFDLPHLFSKYASHQKMIKCHVTWKTKWPMSGLDLLIEFRGFHVHNPPPNAKLNREQTEKLTTIMQHQSNATASQLQQRAILHLDGTSSSVLDINPTLVNTGKLQYHCKKISQQLNPRSEGASEVNSFLSQWRKLQQDFPGWIQSSNFQAGEEIVVMQSPAMALLYSAFDVRTGDQNGYVTDAAHAFFKDGLLLVTCAFNEILLRWVPVVFSYMGSHTKEAYAAHFRVLMKTIKQLVPDCSDAFYANVLDFSAAQRAGYELAFVQHMEEHEGYEASVVHVVETFSCSDNQLMLDNIPELIAAAKEDARRGWVSRAQACLSGCLYHYEKSVTRIKSNRDVVPFDQREYFQTLTHALVNCSNEEYKVTRTAIIKNFPKAEDWLLWWTQSANAALIFQSQKKMPLDLQAQLPRTSNAVESLHSKIYLACRINRSSRLFSLLDGIDALHTYASVLEREIDLCATGHQKSYGEQERSRATIAIHGTSRPRKSMSYALKQKDALHENDGRSLDSSARLEAHQKQKQKQQSEDCISNSVIDGVRYFEKDQKIKSLSYPSTPWESNSCYLDYLLEILYYIYLRDKEQWDSLLDSLPEEQSGLLCAKLWKTVQARHDAYHNALSFPVLSKQLGIQSHTEE